VNLDAAPARREPPRHRWRLPAVRLAVLAYLLFVADGVMRNSRGTSAVTGYVILAAFAACLLTIIPTPTSPLRIWITPVPARRFWIIYAVLTALFAAELPFARASAFVMGVFIAVITVARLAARAAPTVLALAIAALVVPVAVPAWHVTLAAAWADATPIAIPVAALITFIILRSLASTYELADARAELASLAAENERFRIARDLHDLLGHSLTTITVKAGLAARIGQTDYPRALQEISEVEALARQSLTEVRTAVASYRQVTLAGELATGRQLLRAAGIAADLPSAVDDISPANQELFGWIVREGLTNIVRHSRASACSVHLTPSSIEITDDGVGGTGPTGSTGPAGSGLAGLRERVAAAGGSIDAGPARPTGWRLRVSLATTGHAR
jgi:two-component system sensor histidine kinase DesK